MIPAEFLDLIRKATDTGDETARLATVATPNAGGTGATVTFDGETVTATREYPAVGYTPVAGDRVVLLRVGHGWVIVGEVGSTAEHAHPGGSWQTATLVNGWSAFGTNESSFGFRKDAEGWVEIKGTIAGGTVGLSSPFVVLPEGYRAAYAKRIPVLAGGTLGYVRVQGSTTDGTSFGGPGAVAVVSGDNAWVDLSPIRFPLDA